MLQVHSVVKQAENKHSVFHCHVKLGDHVRYLILLLGSCNLLHRSEGKVAHLGK